MTVEFTDELVDLAVNRRVRFIQSAPWNSLTEYTVQAEDGSTVIDVSLRGRPSGKLWWLGLTPDRLAARIYKEGFADLGRLLDDTNKVSCIDQQPGSVSADMRGCQQE